MTFWHRWSKAARRRAVFCGALVLILVGVGAFMVAMPGTSYSGPTVPLDAREQSLADEVEGHVRHLSETIGERNLDRHAKLVAAAYPAVMVTDTAPFRNPHYHQATDRPDTLDYPRLGRVVAGLERVIAALVDR
jgi:hypothetical protein